MMVDNSNKEKLTIDYPCDWIYKTIGTQRNNLEMAISECLLNTPYTLALSNTSSQGTYCCLNVTTTVTSENHRNSLYEKLKSHQHIKMVL